MICLHLHRTQVQVFVNIGDALIQLLTARIGGKQTVKLAFQAMALILNILNNLSVLILIIVREPNIFDFLAKNVYDRV